MHTKFALIATAVVVGLMSSAGAASASDAGINNDRFQGILVDPDYEAPEQEDTTFTGPYSEMIGPRLRAIGQYENGKPTGTWTYTKALGKDGTGKHVIIVKKTYSGDTVSEPEIYTYTWTKEGQPFKVESSYGSFKIIPPGIAECSSGRKVPLGYLDQCHPKLDGSLFAFEGGKAAQAGVDNIASLQKSADRWGLAGKIGGGVAATSAALLAAGSLITLPVSLPLWITAGAIALGGGTSLLAMNRRGGLEDAAALSAYQAGQVGVLQDGIFLKEYSRLINDLDKANPGSNVARVANTTFHGTVRGTLNEVGFGTRH